MLDLIMMSLKCNKITNAKFTKKNSISFKLI